MCGWFIMNVMYNVSLKKVQLVFHMPATVSAVSLLGGIPWVLLLWATGLRKAPKIGAHGWRVLAPIGAAHAVGHAGAVFAIGAGGVSFAQTLKAAEPLFTTAFYNDCKAAVAKRRPPCVRTAPPRPAWTI